MDAGPRRPLVLIIEDDRPARRMYAEALEQEGFSIAEAHNGLQAVEKVLELKPDAIVTDLALPGIDGYEFCRRLHTDEELRGVPVIAITGRYSSQQDVARAIREGCQTVLLKPFTGDDLAAAVRKALEST